MKNLRMIMMLLLCIGFIVGCGDWDNRKALTAANNQIAAKEKEIQELKARQSVVIASAKQEVAVADECQKTMKVDTLIVNKAKIKVAKIDKAKIKVAKIETANVETANVKVANIQTANIETLNAKTVNPPMITWKEKSKPTGKPVAALKCDNDDCWPRNPKGNYFSLGKLGDAILIGNVNNSRYSSDSISAKLEYRSGTWGSRVVVRNITTSPENLLSSGLRQEITNHLARVSPFKAGQSGKEGESCFEKTWIVNPNTGTWSIRK